MIMFPVSLLLWAMYVIGLAVRTFAPHHRISLAYWAFGYLYFFLLNLSNDFVMIVNQSLMGSAVVFAKVMCTFFARGYCGESFR